MQWSNGALVVALFVYAAAFVAYTLAAAGKTKEADREAQKRKRVRAAHALTLTGFAAHLVYFFVRWAAIGHIPVGNLFEFLSCLAMMIVAAFLIVNAIYRSAVLGMFAMPLAVFVLAYAAVFPWDAQPLIPPLQSIWLYIHVTLAAAGEAFFAIGFAAAVMQLIRTVDFSGATKTSVWERRGVEATLLFVLIVAGFVISVFAFRAAGYEAQFEVTDVSNGEPVNTVVQYVQPVIFAPHDSTVVYMDSFLGIDRPLFEAPGWMKGVNAGRKLNTVIWSVLTGLVLYGLIRLLLRKPLGAAIQPRLAELDPDDLDEISYRSIAIGFPVFTLGALIFAMIWAQIAWSRFWGWDPKEVWALITWLYYSAYLHLRLSRGWIGKRSSWLSVIGFLIVLFTLIGVNLLVAGMHSYAGV